MTREVKNKELFEGMKKWKSLVIFGQIFSDSIEMLREKLNSAVQVSWASGVFLNSFAISREFGVSQGVPL